MHLVVVAPGPLPADGAGRVQMTDKFRSGVAAYARDWPGVVTVVACPLYDADDFNLGTRWQSLDELDFELVLEQDESRAATRLRPDIVLAALKNRSLNLAPLADRLVLVAENPVAERLRFAWAERGAWSPLLRAGLGEVRSERSLVNLIRHSAGLQCNGAPGWHAYAKYSSSPLLFFDTRVPRRLFESSSPQSMPASGGHLRMAFSGVFAPHKGPEYAVRMANQMRAVGRPSSLVMFGRGPLEKHLRREAGESVRFMGELTFDPDWMNYMSTEVDLMVLPHVQGDPSGTYLEAAALGIPVLGFDNAALQGLVDMAGLGFTVPMRDEKALLRRACELMDDPDLLARAGSAGREFMSTRCFEDEFARRVHHLRSLVEGSS